MVCTPEPLGPEPIQNIPLGPESIQNILETNDENNEDEKIEVIYKSRFFKKNDSPKKKKTETESSKRISGDWLEALEDSTPSAELKYTPDIGS